MSADPREAATDVRLERALREMEAGTRLKPELRARVAAGRNIFTRQMLAVQADVDRGTLSLDSERHAGILARLADAKRAQTRLASPNAAPDRSVDWRRRAQAAVSVVAGLMVKNWALKAELRDARTDGCGDTSDDLPDRLRGRRASRRGPRPATTRGDR